MLSHVLFHHTSAFSMCKPNPTLTIKSSSVYDYKQTNSTKNDSGIDKKPAVWSNNLISLAIAVALITPLPSSAIPSLNSKSFPIPSTTVFAGSEFAYRIGKWKNQNLPFNKSRLCFKQSQVVKFSVSLELPGNSSDGTAIQQLKDAILKTQKNAKIQVVEDTSNGKYLQAEVDGGFGRIVLDFFINGDVVSYRAMATKVTYVYPFTTALGDSKGQEERLKQIVDELGWYAPRFESMD